MGVRPTLKLQFLWLRSPERLHFSIYDNFFEVNSSIFYFNQSLETFFNEGTKPTPAVL